MFSRANKIRPAVLVLSLEPLLGLGFASTAHAQSGGTPYSLYSIGNSLTYHIMGGDRYKDLAGQSGIDMTWDEHIRCSAGLVDIRNFPTDTCVPPNTAGNYWGQALPNNHWDGVTMQLFGDSLDDDKSNIPFFTNLTQSNPSNASTKFYLYESYPNNLNGEDFSQVWLQPYSGSRLSTFSRDFSNMLMANLARQYPDPNNRPIRMPTGEVLYQIDQLAKAGQIPGMTGVIEDWLPAGDPVHLNLTGSFMCEATWYAVMFNRSPVGLPGPDGSDPALINKCEQTIWNVVQNTTAPAYGLWNQDASANWSSPSSWFGTVPDGAGVNAYFTTPTTADRTVTLDTVKTIGEMEFDNTHSYTIAGAGNLVLSAPGGAVLGSLTGDHVVNVPVQFATDGTLVAVSNATLTLTQLQPTSHVITSTGGGVIQINNIHAAGLVLNGSTLRLAMNGGASGVSRADSLTIGSSSRLDITNNKLITKEPEGSWDDSIYSYSGVNAMVQSGYGNNTWDGPGIVTSVPDAQGASYKSIGVASAHLATGVSGSHTALWGGQTVSAGDTLVMYTYTGDTNLDGKVNIDDYLRIDSGIAAHLSGWSNGDFNYDGVINVDDYIMIDTSIADQGPPIWTFGADPLAITAVPEPTSIGFALTLTSIALAAPRRRVRRAR